MTGSSTVKRPKKQGGAFGAFLRDIAASCYDMRRYREYRTAPLGAAVRYFLAFCLLMSVAMTLTALPSAFGLLRDAREGIATMLPDGASFSVEGGEFSTTLDEPFEREFGRLRVAVDTAVEGTVLPEGRFAGAAVLIGKNAVFFADEGTVQTYALTDMEDGRINKEDLAGWLDRNGALLVFAGTFAFALGYLLAIMIGVGAFAFLAAIAAMFAARVWRVRMGYRAWAATALHAVTLPVLADLAFDTIAAPVPFAFTVLFVMVLVAVLADERMDPVVVEPESDPHLV